MVLLGLWQVDSDAAILAEALWPPMRSKDKLFNGDPATELTYDAWCEYYKAQWHLIAGHGDGLYVAVQSVDDMQWLIAQMTAGRTRRDIVAELKTRCPRNTTVDDEACQNSINMAARMLLMLKFGTVRHQAVSRRCLEWDNGGPLEDNIGDYFSQPPVLHTDHVRLPKAFNAWSIAKIAGIEISFTDNLADHLLLVEDDTKLLVFHHASFLEYQQTSNSLLPHPIVEETLRSLALLFSQSEFSKFRRSAKFKWLDKLCKSQQHCVVDPRLSLCGSLQMEDRQIERFSFWRDRLIILKQAYDDTTPRTLSQWWHDRRNGVQWCTFWVAILVLIIGTLLGLLQCFEGALQVYKAYYPS